MNKRGLFPRLYIGAILAIMYIPILLVIVYSFNRSRLSSVWSGFTLSWYAELFRDRSMFEALRNSLVLGLLTSFASGLIGTLGASGMTFLAFFALLALPLGMVSLVIAHTAFCMPYVYLLVKARLAGLDKSYVEAARIMGAGDLRAFYDITLPLALPAVLSGMLISFAMSFDDVIVSVFVAGAHTNTLPMKIYSQMKTGVTPKTNALCTLLFILTVLFCLAAAALARPAGDGEKGE